MATERLATQLGGMGLRFRQQQGRQGQERAGDQRDQEKAERVVALGMRTRGRNSGQPEPQSNDENLKHRGIPPNPVLP